MPLPDISRASARISSPSLPFPLAVFARFWYFPGVDETAFRALVSGDRRGPAAAGHRAVLWLLKWAYHAAVAARNFGYRSGALRSYRVAVPVISIGNLTTGGTGKTPLVAWLANHLAEAGHSVGLLSRGYRGEADEEGNDEKRLLEALCPAAPHVQDPDRVAAAGQAITEYGCDVLLLDDGFQHRRLGRDLDIVLVDATCPLGFGHLLPRGLLREPPASLKRASLLVLTRIDQVDPDRAAELKRQLSTWIGTELIAEVAFPSTGLVNSIGSTAPLQLLDESRVAAFCGIGNPEAFRAGLDSVAHRAFPDHHRYDDGELTELAGWADRHDADLLLTTRKDLVKIPHTQLGQTPLWAIDTGVEWISGLSILQNALAEVLGSDPP
jgi:tetraacyldisaccharide 4'-kinase